MSIPYSEIPSTSGQTFLFVLAPTSAAASIAVGNSEMRSAPVHRRNKCHILPSLPSGGIRLKMIISTLATIACYVSLLSSQAAHRSRYKSSH